eukprot:GDKH01028317.1.p1 GENE.GDKH01028317.1~~GDKH01028317.1.p1  ORF type:complete len:300 (-),score=17.25 GDKH01028317.1:278-1177(-)
MEENMKRQTTFSMKDIAALPSLRMKIEQRVKARMSLVTATVRASADMDAIKLVELYDSVDQATQVRLGQMPQKYKTVVKEIDGVDQEIESDDLREATFDEVWKYLEENICGVNKEEMLLRAVRKIADLCRIPASSALQAKEKLDEACDILRHIDPRLDLRTILKGELAGALLLTSVRDETMRKILGSSKLNWKDASSTIITATDASRPGGCGETATWPTSRSVAALTTRARTGKSTENDSYCTGCELRGHTNEECYSREITCRDCKEKGHKAKFCDAVHDRRHDRERGQHNRSGMKSVA